MFMQLVTLPQPSTKPVAELVAEELLAGMNAELSRRIEHHTHEYLKFWNASATPDAIAEALGDNGKLLVDASRENLRNIGTLAAMVGKTLDDFIPPQHYAARRSISFEGQRIVLDAPKPGHDAWGRVIPQEPISVP